MIAVKEVSKSSGKLEIFRKWRWRIEEEPSYAELSEIVVLVAEYGSEGRSDSSKTSYISNDS